MTCFPNGALKAVTFSYDDANVADERLVALFNRYGMKGTFNVNSGLSQQMNRPELVQVRRFPGLYRGHEVAVHTVTHLHLHEMYEEDMHREIGEDKRFLTKLMGYEVNGMAFPYGQYSDTTLRVMAEEGIRYSRTVHSTGGFALPTHPLTWDPTCHHNDAPACVERFLAAEATEPMLLYIWGHSYEFDRQNNWELIERVCERLAGQSDLWFATNGEVLDAMEKN